MGFLARRLGFYLVTAWAAISLNFLIPRLMPGNPVSIMLARLGGQATPQAVAALKQAFGLDTGQGLMGQYLTYWNHLAHGDLGVSITYYPERVSTVISQALPWTVVLVGTATVISFALGTLLGVVTGWKRGTAWDLLLPATTLLTAVPYFWIALLALTVFGVHLGWFPLSGGYDDTAAAIGFNSAFVSSALAHAALPALTIVVSSVASPMLGMRNMMITTMGEDYVLLAEAKGLRPRQVMFGYAARNAVLPSVTGFALSLGFVVSGAIVTEIVFSYPGIGYVLFNAVGNEDYPLMQGAFLVVTLAVLAASLLADILYLTLDPRTHHHA